ncbi:MAG: adenylate/guanylate cyclase domain-containing protein [Syntrophobacterales bacterium]|jgi:class 3 adenylate cyclase
MISVEEALIDTMTATFHHLRTGRVPPPIPIPDDLPDNEIRQVLTYLNRFLVEFAPFAEAMEQIAHGELDTRPVFGQMSVVHSLKALQSNLRHLTWKTQQIATGDLEQRVDFMGDFSTAFNSMTQQLKDSRDKLIELNKELERRKKFIRKTFGRYTSDEIVEALLDVPNGQELGGEKREITILLSDLRGFTALAERLEPTEVMALLNYHLSILVEVIQRHGGTIDEIIGDGILVLFGAPVAMEDAAQRAVRCALEMQKAMPAVNEHNLQRGWPEIEMGIALHTGEVVVGNIGSKKRTKYGVVGRTVNLTARIESFTVGGQILVSSALIKAAKERLILGDKVEVHAKGMPEPLRCRELVGHEDHPELLLEVETMSCKPLAEPIPFHYVRLTEKHLDEQMEPGILVDLSRRRAVVEAAGPLPRYANIMLRLEAESGEAQVGELYAKVIRPIDESGRRYLIHFTSASLGWQAQFDRLAGNCERP